MVDALAWRGYKAGQTASTLGLDGSAMYALTSDDTEAINAFNEKTKGALYEMLAADLTIPEEKKTTVMYDADQKSVVNGAYAAMSSEEIATSGIDFACLVDNPKFYTSARDNGANIESNTVKGWLVEKYDGYGLHLNGDAATDARPVVNTKINAYAGGAAYKFYQVIENAPVGVYDVYIQTRTALMNTQPDPEGGIGVFNAMNDETGVWDKYIFAQVNDEDPIMVPFSAGGNWGGYPTVVKNVEVPEGAQLTIGVVEQYVSGKACDHDYAATGAWNTNTTATDARLYFVAPLDGYDYAQAATAIETVEAIKAAQGGAIYNIAGQRVNAGYKGIVIKNGKKYLNK